MPHIPENYTDFLHWIKETTEFTWSKNPNELPEEERVEQWMYGAKWIGLSDDQINSVEKNYAIEFMPEHREFLKILHTVDRLEEYEYIDTIDGKEETLILKEPFLYNWLEEDIQIKEKLTWPYDTILKDILGINKVWSKAWGAKPKSNEDKIKTFTDLFSTAPKLIPIASHRFLVSDKDIDERPVLSIYGADTIIYSWNLRHFLLNKLQGSLNTAPLIYNKEEGFYTSEFFAMIEQITNVEWAKGERKNFYFWTDLIAYNSYNWEYTTG